MTDNDTRAAKIEAVAKRLAAFDGLDWCFNGETDNPHFRKHVRDQYEERAGDALDALEPFGLDAANDGDEFLFSALLQQVAALLSSGDAETMLLWWRDGRFHCTFNAGAHSAQEHQLIEAAIAGAVIEAERVAAARKGE